MKKNATNILPSVNSSISNMSIFHLTINLHIKPRSGMANCTIHVTYKLHFTTALCFKPHY